MVTESIKNAATKSWRTTALGVLAFLGAAAPELAKLLDADAATNPDWRLIVLGVIGLFGGAVARDNKVSSEAAGAK